MGRERQSRLATQSGNCPKRQSMGRDSTRDGLHPIGIGTRHGRGRLLLGFIGMIAWGPSPRQMAHAATSLSDPARRHRVHRCRTRSETPDWSTAGCGVLARCTSTVTTAGVGPVGSPCWCSCMSELYPAARRRVFPAGGALLAKGSGACRGRISSRQGLRRAAVLRWREERK